VKTELCSNYTYILYITPHSTISFLLFKFVFFKFLVVHAELTRKLTNQLTSEDDNGNKKHNNKYGFYLMFSVVASTTSHNGVHFHGFATQSI
jgi:hypothetical protein